MFFAKTVSEIFVPFGDITINQVIDSLKHVEGGTSKSDVNGMKYLGEHLISAAAKKAGEEVSIAFNVYSAYKSLESRVNTMLLDDVNFSLIYDNGVKRYYHSVEEANKMMLKSTNFLTSNDVYSVYFFGVSVNGMTLYELDRFLANSKDPNKEIQKIVKRYKSDLIWTYGVHFDIETYGNMLESNLKQYNSRLSQVNTDYKSYMSEYLM